MLRRLQHCGLVVSDLEASRRFYGHVLGMEELERPASFSFAGAWFGAGGSEIHLILEADTTGVAGIPDPGRSLETGLATHLALEVESLARAQRRLEEHGIALAAGPMPRGDGVRQIFVRDPDGYVVEFFEVTGEHQADVRERAPVRS